ncbi:MAG TPA: hypothetical protein VFT16_01640 [Candidatus Saccharimonadales bacterium]|nr:hypothetical protein [Candidatus Saccharimonadales bacterium]
MKKHLIISAICLVVLLATFMGTNATKVPSFLLMLPFMLLFVLMASLLSTIFRLQGISALRSWRTGLVLAGVPIILLVLQSIGQLTVKDVLTIAVLLGVSYFYVSRSTASP